MAFVIGMQARHETIIAKEDKEQKEPLSVIPFGAARRGIEPLFPP